MKSVNVQKMLNAINSLSEAVDCKKRNFGALPKAKDARLVPCTNTGKYAAGSQYTTKSWNIEVDVVVNGLVVTHDWNVWLVSAGMKCTTARFTDLAKAKAMKKEILTKWGKIAEEREDKAKAKVSDVISKLAAKLNCSVDEVKALLAD